MHEYHNAVWGVAALDIGVQQFFPEVRQEQLRLLMSLPIFCDATRIQHSLIIVFDEMQFICAALTGASSTRHLLDEVGGASSRYSSEARVVRHIRPEIDRRAVYRCCRYRSVGLQGSTAR